MLLCSLEEFTKYPIRMGYKMSHDMTCMNTRIWACHISQPHTNYIVDNINYMVADERGLCKIPFLQKARVRG